MNQIQVGDFAGEAHLVGDADHGEAVIHQRADDLQHLTHHFRIERAGGLVEQHDRRLHRQGAGDCDPLLLAAGKIGRKPVRAVGEADTLQQLRRPRVRLGLRLVQQPPEAERDVVAGGQMRKQVELLEKRSRSCAAAG